MTTKHECPRREPSGSGATGRPPKIRECGPEGGMILRHGFRQRLQTSRRRVAAVGHAVGRGWTQREARMAPPHDQVVEHLHPDDLASHFKGVAAILKTKGRYIFATPHSSVGPAGHLTGLWM